MLGISSQSALKNLLIAVGRGETTLESLRQRLCLIPNFEASTVMQRLDRCALGRVNGTDIWNFLRDRGNLSATLGECDQLVRFFDSDCDGVLNLSE